MANQLTLVADTELRQLISGFTRADTSSNDSTYTVTESATSKKITFTVSVYESDHGFISIVNMNPDCSPDTTNKDDGFLVNPEYIGWAELIPVGSTMLEDQGGGSRGYIDAVGAFICHSPLAHGLITDITA